MSSPGRNDPCSCGSGKKYKRCCYMEEWKGRVAALAAWREEMRKPSDGKALQTFLSLAAAVSADAKTGGRNE